MSTLRFLAATRSRVAKSSRISVDLPDEVAERIAYAERGGRRAVVVLEAQRRSAHDDLAAGRELHLGDAMGTQPGTVRAARVVHVNSVACAPDPQVDAADARVVEHEIVRRVSADGREGARHCERATGARTGRRDELGNGREGPLPDSGIDLGAATRLVLRHSSGTIVAASGPAWRLTRGAPAVLV